MSSYQAVLFDLDGTLLDTIDDLADSMNSVLRQHGFPEHTVAAYKHYVGDGVETLAQRVLPENRRDEETVRACFTAMREAYRTRWATKSRPYPGILDLLDALTARGTTMTVFSNKPDEFTRLMIAYFFPAHPFARVVGAKQGVPKKPDPAGALAIAVQLGVPPAEFLYVGDTNTDMKTAVAAGMYPVGVLWGFREADELLASGATTLIAYPMELLALLDASA